MSIEVGSNKLWEVRNQLGNAGETVTIYGELIGKNVQRGVAVSELEKRWVIFAASVNYSEEDIEWLDLNMIDIQLPDTNNRIFLNTDFPTLSKNICFETPQESLAVLEGWVKEIETECPVGRHFGVLGVGEGIVIRCTNDGYGGPEFWGKIKGEKHKTAGNKPRTNKMRGQTEDASVFLEMVLTEPRLNQGIEYLNEMNLPIDRTSTGKYLEWVMNDVGAECVEELKECNLNFNHVKAPLNKNSREWFFSYIDSNLNN